jgi:hypothetical protein
MQRINEVIGLRILVISSRTGSKRDDSADALAKLDERRRLSL